MSERAGLPPTTDAFGISRRGFLGASGAAGAVALTGRRASRALERIGKDERADVAIVGAGIAGLVAARALRAGGLDVLVLEASDHAGGRVASGDGDLPIDPAVPATHDSVVHLAEAIGLRTRSVTSSGKRVILHRRERRLGEGSSISGDAALDREIGVALSRLNLMAAEVDPAAPWAKPNAEARDATAFGTWIAANVRRGPAEDFMTLITRVLWAAEPAELSLLHVLATIAGAGGVSHLLNASLAPGFRGPVLAPTPGHHSAGRGCQACRSHDQPWVSIRRGDVPSERVRIQGGPAGLVDRLVKSASASLRSPAPVQTIVQGDAGVTLEGPDFRVTAGRALVAVPMSSLTRVEFQPALTADESGLRLSGGDVVTLVCHYDRPFWEGNGLSGLALSTSGPLTLGQARRNGGEGVIVSHACGAAARSWLEHGGTSVGDALGALADWFGPEAAEPRDAVLTDWRDSPWHGVGWGLVAPPGTVTSTVRASRRRHDRVHWAGAERSATWAGWLEGAVRSGEGAAREVLAALGERPSAGIGAEL